MQDDNNISQSLRVPRATLALSDQSTPPSSSKKENRRSVSPFRKANSTSTVFIQSTMNVPNSKLILYCVAKSIQWCIHDTKGRGYIENFDERIHPLGDGKKNFRKIPDFEEVMGFLRMIFYQQDMAAEVAVMATAYIDRFVINTGVNLAPHNWRRIVLGSFLVADKVWEEEAVWNVDFQKSFPNLEVEDINRLEYEFLVALQYSLTLNASVYAVYYFALRSIADISSLPMKPLDKESARILEEKSRGTELALAKINDKGGILRKAQSVQETKQPSKPTLSVEQLRTSRRDTMCNT